MIESLNEKDVLHVMNLARLKEDEKNYKEQLNDILTEINKILDVEIEEEEIMISPSDNFNRYNSDVVEDMVCKEDMLNMANKSNGEFIVVSRVLND